MTRRLPTCPVCGHTPYNRGLDQAKAAMAQHLRDHDDLSDAQKRDAWKKLDFGVWPPQG
jgi:hypothetical protein